MAVSAGSSAWVSSIGARKLTFITVSNSSTVTWSNRPPSAMPALLISSPIAGCPAQHPGGHAVDRVPVGQVGDDRLDAGRVPIADRAATEASRTASTSTQHQVAAAPGQLIGELLADAAGRAGEDGGAGRRNGTGS